MTERSILDEPGGTREDRFMVLNQTRCFSRDCEFKSEHQIRIAGLNVQSYPGKKIRAELLVHIKERAGMTYREIAKLDLFADLELSSLECIYRRALLNRPG